MPEQDVHLGHNGYSICRVQFFNRKARRNCEEVVLIFGFVKPPTLKGIIGYGKVNGRNMLTPRAGPCKQ
jgi:hypothetical protein